MTRDEIISMARECGIRVGEWWAHATLETSGLLRFAALVAARGREAERSRWRAVLDAVVREAPHKHDGPDAPGHSHRIPGVWDQYNGPKSGTTCAWCAAWKTAHELLEEEAIRARADNEPNRLPSHRCSSLCSPDETFCAITKDGKCDATDRSCDAALAATEPKP